MNTFELLQYTLIIIKITVRYMAQGMNVKLMQTKYCFTDIFIYMLIRLQIQNYIGGFYYGTFYIAQRFISRKGCA